MLLTALRSSLLVSCSVSCNFNWSRLLRSIKLALTIHNVSCEGDVECDDAISRAVTSLRTRLFHASQIAMLQSAMFAEQLNERTATFHQALIHLTNCANGRASLSTAASVEGSGPDMMDVMTSSTFPYPSLLPTSAGRPGIHVAAIARGTSKPPLSWLLIGSIFAGAHSQVGTVYRAATAKVGNSTHITHKARIAIDAYDSVVCNRTVCAR